MLTYMQRSFRLISRAILVDICVDNSQHHKIGIRGELPLIVNLEGDSSR